jgi:hypothetical protein
MVAIPESVADHATENVKPSSALGLSQSGPLAGGAQKQHPDADGISDPA